MPQPTSAAWFDELVASAPLAPPDGLPDWASTQASFQAAFDTCPRMHWLLWLVASNRPDERLQHNVIIAGTTFIRGGETGLLQALSLFSPVYSPLQVAEVWAHKGEVEGHLVGTVKAGQFMKAAMVALAINMVGFNLSKLPRYYLPQNAGTGILFILLFAACYFPLWYLLGVLRRWQLQRALRHMDFAGAVRVVIPATERAERRHRPERRAPSKEVRSILTPR